VGGPFRYTRKFLLRGRGKPRPRIKRGLTQGRHAQHSSPLRRRKSSFCISLTKGGGEYSNELAEKEGKRHVVHVPLTRGRVFSRENGATKGLEEVPLPSEFKEKGTACRSREGLR